MEYREVAFLAFGACMTALNIALTAVLALIPYINAYVSPLLCLTMIPVIDLFGRRRALLVWIATALIMLFLGTYGDHLVLYLVVGWYPVIAPWIRERVLWVRIICKVMIGIIDGCIICLIGRFLLGRTLKINLFGHITDGFQAALLMILLFIVLMILLDKLLERFRMMYAETYRKHIIRLLEPLKKK